MKLTLNLSETYLQLYPEIWNIECGIMLNYDFNKEKRILRRFISIEKCDANAEHIQSHCYFLSDLPGAKITPHFIRDQLKNQLEPLEKKRNRLWNSNAETIEEADEIHDLCYELEMEQDCIKEVICAMFLMHLLD